MYDKEIHKEYVFTSYLQKLMPKPERISLDLEDKLRLEYYKLEQTFKGDISLNPTVEDSTVGYGESDTDSAIEEEDFLEEIIEKINERYGGDISDSDRVVIDHIYKEASQAIIMESLKTYIKTNDKKEYNNNTFTENLEEIVFKLLQENKERDNSYKKLFQDKEFYNAAMSAVGEMIYRKYREN